MLVMTFLPVQALIGHLEQGLGSPSWHLANLALVGLEAMHVEPFLIASLTNQPLAARLEQGLDPLAWHLAGLVGLDSGAKVAHPVHHLVPRASVETPTSHRNHMTNPSHSLAM